MSAVIAGTIIAGAALAYTVYSGEEQKKAQRAAINKQNKEQGAIMADLEWQKKKKGINDMSASRSALRLRDGAQSGNTLPAGVSGASNISNNMGASLGGLGNSSAPTGNVPLGL